MAYLPQQYYDPIKLNSRESNYVLTKAIVLKSL